MVIADVSKEEDCKEIVNVAADKLGGIDILIILSTECSLFPCTPVLC